MDGKKIYSIVDIANDRGAEEISNLIKDKLPKIIGALIKNTYSFTLRELNENQKIKRTLKSKIGEDKRGVYFFEIEAWPFIENLQCSNGKLTLEYDVVVEMMHDFYISWQFFNYVEGKTKIEIDHDRLYNVFLELTKYYHIGDEVHLQYLPLYVGRATDLSRRIVSEHLISSAKGLKIGKLDSALYNDVTIRVTYADTNIIFNSNNEQEMPDVDETYLFEKILSYLLHPLLGQ